MQTPSSPAPNSIAVLKWAFLGAILIVTGVGFFLGPHLEPSLEDDMRYVFGGVLFTVGVSSLLLVRYVVLPAMASHSGAKPQAIGTTAYAFAEAPATYGLVLAIMTAEGWAALPFGALALVGWLTMSNYITSIQAAAPVDFPRL